MLGDYDDFSVDDLHGGESMLDATSLLDLLRRLSGAPLRDVDVHFGAGSAYGPGLDPFGNPSDIFGSTMSSGAEVHTHNRSTINMVPVSNDGRKLYVSVYDAGNYTPWSE